MLLPNIKLSGDKERAAKYLPVARKMLGRLSAISPSVQSRVDRGIVDGDIDILVASYPGGSQIHIFAPPLELAEIPADIEEAFDCSPSIIGHRARGPVAKISNKFYGILRQLGGKSLIPLFTSSAPDDKLTSLNRTVRFVIEDNKRYAIIYSRDHNNKPGVTEVFYGLSETWDPGPVFTTNRDLWTWYWGSQEFDTQQRFSCDFLTGLSPAHCKDRYAVVNFNQYGPQLYYSLESYYAVVEVVSGDAVKKPKIIKTPGPYLGMAVNRYNPDSLWLLIACLGTEDSYEPNDPLKVPTIKLYKANVQNITDDPDWIFDREISFQIGRELNSSDNYSTYPYCHFPLNRASMEFEGQLDIPTVKNLGAELYQHSFYIDSIGNVTDYGEFQIGDLYESFYNPLPEEDVNVADITTDYKYLKQWGGVHGFLCTYSSPRYPPRTSFDIPFPKDTGLQGTYAAGLLFPLHENLELGFLIFSLIQRNSEADDQRISQRFMFVDLISEEVYITPRVWEFKKVGLNETYRLVFVIHEADFTLLGPLSNIGYNTDLVNTGIGKGYFAGTDANIANFGWEQIIAFACTDHPNIRPYSTTSSQYGKSLTTSISSQVLNPKKREESYVVYGKLPIKYFHMHTEDLFKVAFKYERKDKKLTMLSGSSPTGGTRKRHRTAIELLEK